MMRISYEFYSAIGRKKKNEDAVGISVNRKGEQDAYLFAVADGAGTKRGAEMAINTLTHVFPNEDAKEALLPGMFQLAERMLQKMEDMEKLPRKSFRTTLAALQMDPDSRSFRFAHQGDSRVYVFRNGKLFARTLDHSIAQKMVNNGQMPEMLLRTSAERNQITRLLGVGLRNPWDSSDVYELKESMSFLLCTDGFWNYVYENEMEETLEKAEFVGEWLARMKRIACERGMQTKMDNHSAIAVFCR